jgi:hypothetical protein
LKLTKVVLFLRILFFSFKAKDRYIEDEPMNIPIGITVQNLTKRFKEKTAVNDLSLNFYEGQITALLG